MLDAESKHGTITAALDAATSSLDEVRSKRDAAKNVANECDSEEATRRSDLEFREEEFELIRMKERLQHVTAADSAAAEASAVVSISKITEELRTKIRNADIRLKTEQGILNAASPKLTITALESVAISVDGDPFTLDAGQVRTLALKETVSATIGRIAEIRGEPGTSSDSLKQTVADAESSLAKLCAQSGVASPEEAETVWASLVEAKRTLGDRDRIAKEHLRDLTREELGKRIQTSAAKVDSYRSQRASEIALPASADECRTLLASATTVAVAARSHHKKEEAIFEKIRENHTSCRENHARSSAILDRERQDLQNTVERLKHARSLANDETLEKVFRAEEIHSKAANASFITAKNQLDFADPTSAKSMWETATVAAKLAQEQFDLQDRELVELGAKLDFVGDRGIAEGLDQAKRAKFESEDSLTRLQRRALAAKLLYETLASERIAMRRAYVAPLKEGIERLARHVYGPTFRVDVDERLQVVSRTVDGVTLSTKQLSTGAQEQLGLLARLAAASMVSQEGGVPLVLDDALGSTDEDRLQAMGAVLRVASKDTQTIIITCAPERYVHVGAQISVAMSRSNVLGIQRIHE
jgi:hypothetical protein